MVEMAKVMAKAAVKAKVKGSNRIHMVMIAMPFAPTATHDLKMA